MPFGAVSGVGRGMGVGDHWKGRGSFWGKCGGIRLQLMGTLWHSY